MSNVQNMISEGSNSQIQKLIDIEKVMEKIKNIKNSIKAYL